MTYNCIFIAYISKLHHICIIAAKGNRIIEKNVILEKFIPIDPLSCKFGF